MDEAESAEGFVMREMPTPVRNATSIYYRRDSLLALSPAERMKRVLLQARDLSRKYLHEIMAPILQTQQKWI